MPVTSHSETRRPRLASARTRLTALSAVALLLVAGCGDHVGSAAVVGTTDIPESSIVGAPVDPGSSLANPGAASAAADAPAQAAREALTQQIRHVLVTRAAAEQGINLPEGRIAEAKNGLTDDQIAQILQVPAARADQALRDGLLAITLLRKNAAKPISDVRVTADVLGGFQTLDDALARRQAYLADPEKFTADLSAGDAQQMTTRNHQFTLLTMPSVAQTGLYSAPVGAVVALPVQGRFYLAKVLKREVVQGADLASGVQASQSDPDAFALAYLVLQPTAGQVPISVNPRFGTWDPLTVQVVPSASDS